MFPTIKGTFIVLFLPHLVYAWFRVACTNPLVQVRLDPVVNPGISPANHVHTVHGANHFSSNSTYDTLRNSSCTSCLVAQDLSNYWFPKLYFRDPQTGKYQDVPNGGLLVYYQNRGSADVSLGGTGLRAFPPGLKMISGSPVRRSRKYTPGLGSQEELAERAVEWSCLRYTTTTGYDSNKIGATGFPDTTCEAGLNARIHMPACWDGVNVDSPDHKSHVAFLSKLDNGECPSTHPVGMMKMLYEVTWDVEAFASQWDPAKDKWPFVYSVGDSTGYGWHADFQNGWDVQALQDAIDHCNYPGDATSQGDTAACRFLTVISGDDAKKCTINATVNEPITGVLDRIPGCNPLQMGPDDATLYTDSDCPAFAANGSLAAPPSPSPSPPAPSNSHSAPNSGPLRASVGLVPIVASFLVLVCALVSGL